jgi:SNF family Na+-dependent transporter
MIAYLNGILAEKSPAGVIVECGGVGYEALIPLSTFDRLPATGQAVKLFTYHAVREDDEVLFGFSTPEEREMFTKVTSVSGVGPKTALAVLSGFMIIPVVVLFAAKSGAGRAAIDAGPGLMFVTLPKVFSSLGAAGQWLALAFFVLVLFAAFTSAISMTEACVAAVCDYLHVKRNTSVAAVCAWCVAVGSLSAFGYGRWSAFKPFGLPALDFFDSSMNVLTPIVAALICVFAGWVLRPKRILAECRRDGSAVGFKTFYAVMVKFIAPLLVLAILVSEICRTLGIGGWKI